MLGIVYSVITSAVQESIDTMSFPWNGMGNAEIIRLLYVYIKKLIILFPLKIYKSSELGEKTHNLYFT